MDFRISAIYPLISAVLSIFLTVFVVVKGYRRALNISFALICLNVGFYSFGAFMEFTSIKIYVAYFWARFLHIGVVFLPFAFINFVYTFLEIKKKNLFYWTAFSFSLFFVFTLLLTPWLVKGVQPKEFVNFYSIPGPLYAPFAIIFIILLLKAYHILWQGYRRSKGLRKLQIRYIYLSTFLGFLVGLTLGFGVIFEKIRHVPPSIHHIGALIYIFGIAYSIFRHQLLDIRVIITRVGISLAAYSAIFMVPFFVGYKTGMWPLATVLATVLAIPATLIYRRFRVKTENILLKKQRYYRNILLSSSEHLTGYKDKDSLLQDMATLIFGKAGPSFVAVYMADNNKYFLNAVLPAHLSMPQIIDSSAAVFKKMESDSEVYYFGGQEVALSLFMGDKQQPKGVVFLGEKTDKEIYYDEDREVFEAFMNQVSVALENIENISAYVAEREEKERLQQEIKLAYQIQQNLLPKTIPVTKSFTVDGKLIPAKEVAGDYYDFIAYSPERLGIVIADVSGKGVDAGMVMSITKSALITLTRGNLSPLQLVVELNKVLYAQLKNQRFISLNYAEYDALKNTFTWAGAGHEHILHYHSSKNDSYPATVEVIRTGGIVLGILEDISEYVTQQTITLQEKDKIVLYTDGVIEAKDTQDKMLSLGGFVNIIEQFPADKEDKFMQYLFNELQQYASDEPQKDDITIVVIERKETMGGN